MTYVWQQPEWPHFHLDTSAVAGLVRRYKPSLLKGLKRISSLSTQVTRSYLVYSGDYFEFSDGSTALKYDQVSEVFSESR